ncbi:hypothetical protein HPB49_011923 [Dermacentor silvarum]|uniref:Uncharacterized protein n=1 Tax=Dermacentor silvarum TaxID=543639 RepID=A0ACB8D522_DERSI|nr:hypothetical protein HPB49_011923 [Dermacentor silvarum]
MATTLVSDRHTAVQEHLDHLNNENEESVFLKCRFFREHDMNIINTYRLPNTKFHRTPWHHLLRQLEKSDLLWTGDFNSRHAYWGYPDSSAAGRILLDLAHTHQLSLLNDISTPTRTGNSVQRDTNPDLAWGRTRKTPDWRNLGETFGSDHCILEITVPLPNRQRSPKRGYYSIATELIDWDAFRKVGLPQCLRGETLAHVSALESHLSHAVASYPTARNRESHLYRRLGRPRSVVQDTSTLVFALGPYYDGLSMPGVRDGWLFLGTFRTSPCSYLRLPPR